MKCQCMSAELIPDQSDVLRLWRGRIRQRPKVRRQRLIDLIRGEPLYDISRPIPGQVDGSLRRLDKSADDIGEPVQRSHAYRNIFGKASSTVFRTNNDPLMGQPFKSLDLETSAIVRWIDADTATVIKDIEIGDHIMKLNARPVLRLEGFADPPNVGKG